MQPLSIPLNGLFPLLMLSRRLMENVPQKLCYPMFGCLRLSRVMLCWSFAAVENSVKVFVFGLYYIRWNCPNYLRFVKKKHLMSPEKQILFFVIDFVSPSP